MQCTYVQEGRYEAMAKYRIGEYQHYVQRFICATGPCAMVETL